MVKKGLIFDLDGTLWDATEQIVISNNMTLSKYPDIDRRVTVAEMQSYMGKTIEVIADLVFPDMPADRRRSVMYKCCEEEAEYFRQHGGNLYPNLYEALGEAKIKYHLFVVSNCQDGYLQACLDYHELWGYFDDIEMAGRTGLTKGENIKLIMERNNLTDAIYIGDTTGDKDGADFAGIPFIHAAYGFGKVPNAEYKIDTISEITQRADEVFSHFSNKTEE
jgi:phosphoglycolate phosphatase